MAITVTHSKVSTVPDGDDTSVVRPSDWNDDHVLVGLGTMAEQNANAVAITGGTMSGVAVSGYVPTTETISAGTGLTGGGDLSAPRTLALANTAVTTGTYGTAARTITQTVDQQGRLTNIFDQPIEIANTQVTGLGTASTKDAGAANGVATLDATGKVPVSELPAAVLGALSYQGTWNASTNTPTLTSSVGTKGYYYVVSVAGNTDLNGITDWLVGDWAVYNGTEWQKVDNTDAGGDVVGPSSATDNAIARFDTTTGKLIQNSVVTIDDAGNEAGINSISFDTTPSTVPTTPGSLYWDSANGNQTLSLVMANGDATQQIGEETYFRIRASAAITEGQVVMFTGTIGGSGALTGAPASGLTATTASYVMGIATHNLAINEWGYITSFGLVRGINTTGGAEAWVDGQILYYNPAVAGGLTKTVPVAPNAKIQVCAVVNAASGGSGSLFVRPTFGGALGQYEGDVQVTTPANGDLLIRNQTTGEWINAPLTAGTAISVTNTAGAVSIANTAPDQTVSLTAGTGISTSGTYPNFTITNTAPSSGGTVTSVSGTTGRITSTGGTTPVIDLASGVATAGTTGSSTLIPVVTIDTYGRVTGITTAANPQGTVTSVTGTAPVVSSGGATPAISMAAANTTTNGYLTSTDWNTFNGKAPAVTYTTGYVPFGQGTTTPNQSASFRFVSPNVLGLTGNLTASIPAWSITGNQTALQLGTVGSISSLSNSTGNQQVNIGNNVYDFYAPKYITSDAASAFRMLGGGAFAWYQAASGTAGASISFTQAMTLHGSGGLSLGNTTDPGATNLSVTGKITVQGLTVGKGLGSVANNVSLGTGTFNASTTGDSNIAIGTNTCSSITSGGDNICIGTNAGLPITTGPRNICIGTASGQYGTGVTTGGYNVLIGFGAIPSAAAGNQQVVIGYGTPFTGKGNNTAYIGGSSGAYNEANSTLWSITSDARIKENVATLTNGLSTILALRPVEFDYIETKKHDVSFIAQEYQKILPEQVKEHAANESEKLIADSDTLLGLTPNLVPYLVLAIQELKAEFDAYKATHP